MKHVSFPLYTFSKSGPESVFDSLSAGIVVNFILFFLVLFLVYYLVRYITKSGQSNMRSRNLRMVEKLPLGLERYIVIFELKKTYYIMYLDKNGSHLIDKRDDLDIESVDKTVEFHNILSKLTTKKDTGQDESNDK